MKKEELIDQKANAYIKHIIWSSTLAGADHPSSALSLAHIIAGILTLKKFNPEDPFDRKKNDALILSEGHAVPVLYTAWAFEGMNYSESGYAKRLTLEMLDTLRDINSPLEGHPVPISCLANGKITNLPFPSATGALGQGLSIMAGIALADLFDGIKRNHFVICGDSEFREGQIDEALRFINTEQLPITLFLNLNEWGQSAKTKDLIKHNYKKELQAKDWDVIEINGHNSKEIVKVLSKDYKKPTAILAHTIKGWGVKRLQEGNWHGKVLSKEDAEKVLKNLPKTDLKIPDTKGTGVLINKQEIYLTLKAKLPVPKFSDKISARKGYGYALKELGKDERIVVCDAEVSNSTMTEIFREKYSKRYVECAIAEQNMMSVASGLASQGKIVFANTFARFLETCFSQWNISQQSKIPLHVVGSHVGLGPHSDGPSQMALADVAYALAMPYLSVLSPSDAVSAYYLTEQCALHKGPTYQRNYRPDMPLLYDVKDSYFFIGGSRVLKKGTDCLFIAHGYMVHFALELAKELEKEKINVGVIDAYSLKPLDIKTISNESADLKKPKFSPFKCIYTFEDNFGGGLGSQVASLFAHGSDVSVEQFFVERWPKSARSMEEMLKYCGFDKRKMILKILNNYWELDKVMKSKWKD
ncbi:transketolase [Candidatus Woesearchaeota archaeon]|nr:transketolase [Candidatus Woesearchaeota archaeon]